MTTLLINGGRTDDSRNYRLTVGDLKRHRGDIYVWARIWDEDGEYFRVSKGEVLRKIGANVPASRDGLADDTPLSKESRIGDNGTLYID